MWTGPSGVTQLLGLSQGVLDVSTDDAGNIVVSSTVTDALMVDAGGQPLAGITIQLGKSEGQQPPRPIGRSAGW